MWLLPKYLLVGHPLRSARLGETLLPKRIALPVFCSDPLSSVAYATEEILLVLSLGGLALLGLAWWVGAFVVVLLVVVVVSYRQTCYAYPAGGGAYAVSRGNLGRNPALVAASALLIDYVLTVAVSVAAGTANIVSAFPGLAPHAVPLSVGLVGVLAVLNLRGVRQSGRLFAIPTYGFVAVVLLMLGIGAARVLVGHTPRAESADLGIHTQTSPGGMLLLLLALRAFASGCTALTGVEAVSNGVPSFQPPKSRNAARTLEIMGGLAITMFAGITALALVTHVHVATSPEELIGAPSGYHQRTVIAQLGGAIFGDSALFYLLQTFTAGILVLAANTAFNGFPILASVLGSDGFLPRQFARRGDRLAFSNGILALAVLASALIWVFDASTNRLIQLYIVGVFVAFTLSQAGMVRHWTDLLHTSAESSARRRIRRSRTVNRLGASLTALVLLVVLVTKFIHGAWLVVVAIPLLFLTMNRIKGHYDRTSSQLRAPVGGVTLPSRVHGVVLVSRLHAPTLRALSFARATKPTTLTAVTVRTHPTETEELERDWESREIPVPLVVLDSPYRDITGPIQDYVSSIRRQSPRDVVSVFVPEYVVGHWWEQLLHNQSALRVKIRLLSQEGVMVTSVPWQLPSSAALLGSDQGAAPEARRSATVAVPQ